MLWLWAFSFLAQVLVLTLLFLRGNFRKLPLFSAYVALNICQAGFLVFVYSHPWSDPATPGALAWTSELTTLIAQALATTEILEIALRPYQGIWGLGWRALTVTSGVVVLLVALADGGHWGAARWFQLDRGYHLTFASALIACLLLVRYYSISVPLAYKMILAGFCFYSCTQILVNTFLQAFFYRDFFLHEAAWQLLTMFSFVAVQAVWAAALWKPLPVEDRQVASSSDAVYQRFSPEINEDLRRLNERLLRLLKMEARPH
ncbi:MAG: hypothetical protein WB627_08830 [Candidatus Acidiferrum sp.]